MIKLNIWKVIRLKPISENPELFPTQVTIIRKFVFKTESHEGLIFLMK